MCVNQHPPTCALKLKKNTNTRALTNRCLFICLIKILLQFCKDRHNKNVFCDYNSNNETIQHCNSINNTQPQLYKISHLNPNAHIYLTTLAKDTTIIKISAHMKHPQDRSHSKNSKAFGDVELILDHCQGALLPSARLVTFCRRKKTCIRKQLSVLLYLGSRV